MLSNRLKQCSPRRRNPKKIPLNPQVRYTGLWHQVVLVELQLVCPNLWNILDAVIMLWHQGTRRTSALDVTLSNHLGSLYTFSGLIITTLQDSSPCSTSHPCCRHSLLCPHMLSCSLHSVHYSVCFGSHPSWDKIDNVVVGVYCVLFILAILGTYRHSGTAHKRLRWVTIILSVYIHANPALALITVFLDSSWNAHIISRVLRPLGVHV